MLKALRRFTQLLRVHIYVPGCCKYIRMTNGLQPLVELCMDGCFADKAVIGPFQPNVWFLRLTIVFKTRGLNAAAAISFKSFLYFGYSRACSSFRVFCPDDLPAIAGLRGSTKYQSQPLQLFC